MTIADVISPADVQVRLAARPQIALSAQERERLLRIVSDSIAIKTHCDLFLWLNGEMRKLFPHQILISAWGDYANRDIEVDIISGLPGVRTAEIARCGVQEIVLACYTKWVSGERKPLLHEPLDAIIAGSSCSCAVHRALRQMRSMLVHGVRDQRNDQETLYIAFDCAMFPSHSRERLLSLFDLLISQLDFALRKVAAYPLNGAGVGHAPHGLGLSRREVQIVELICRGRPNLEIAAALEISHFTVKNHLQRIFRKLSVSNRTEAAAKYNYALRQSRNA